MAGTSYSTLPNDAKIIYLILQSMGVESCETRVIHQLMEFSYRYITDVLQESLIYADHAGRSDVDMKDIQLAIQSKTCYGFAKPPPRDFLLEVAKERNKTPLPMLEEKHGLRLPEDKYTLTAVNYQIFPHMSSQDALTAQARATVKQAKEMTDLESRPLKKLAMGQDGASSSGTSKAAGGENADGKPMRTGEERKDMAMDEEIDSGSDEDDVIESEIPTAVKVDTWEGKRAEDEDYDD